MISKAQKDCVFLIVFTSTLFILSIKASHSPRLKVNFGLNLPGLSFQLPSMSLPKMKITAVIARSPSHRPMRIQLPAISLHAKSLEDNWSGGGGGGGGDSYGNSYSNQGGNYISNNNDGWSNNNKVDEGKPYETGYASEHEEEFVEPSDEDSYDEEAQSESSEQNNSEPALNDNSKDYQIVNNTSNHTLNVINEAPDFVSNNFRGINGFPQSNGQPHQPREMINFQKNILPNGINQFNDFYPKPETVHSQANIIPFNNAAPRYNQQPIQNQLYLNNIDNHSSRDQIKLAYNGNDVNKGYQQFIVKVPRDFQLPQISLKDLARHNSQQFIGNYNENYIHQLSYPKRVIINNEPMKLTKAVLLSNAPHMGYRDQPNDQHDFSKRSVLNPNFYKFALVT